MEVTTKWQLNCARKIIFVARNGVVYICEPSYIPAFAFAFSHSLARQSLSVQFTVSIYRFVGVKEKGEDEGEVK